MSDTPRTDAEAFWPHDSQYKVCDAVFARQLEGELNAANTIIRQQQLLNEENLRLQERIKRLEEDLNELRSDEARLLNLNGELERRIKLLEEAGDAMVSHAKALGMDGTGLVKRWFKAKEAKP
jgi:chromosome segregation ATPase